MRPHIKKFIDICSTHLDLPEPIIEIGSKRPPSQDNLANLRPLFPGRTFMGCDMEAGNGVDRIENLENLTFKDGEVGTFILCDTLEHVRDLDRAMKELERCLNSRTGVLIATSVMLFPVHGFPNDYWRFTPEGFRELAKTFPWVATFFGGDPNFPHTVACIACRFPQKNQTKFDRLVQAVADLTPVPHHADAKSKIIFSSLGSLLLRYALAAGQKELPLYGDMGMLSKENWILFPGSWIRIALPQSVNSSQLELTASGGTIQLVNRASWNTLLDETETDLPETAFLFAPAPDTPSGVNQLEAYLVSTRGEKTLLARSALGIILPLSDLPRGLSLHSVDNRCPPFNVNQTTSEHAKILTRSLREHGEKIILDLGCGFRKAGNIGIDIQAKNNDADLICLLGFEQLPFEDATVDEVVCRDFLEHLPKAVYLETKGRFHYPVIQLIDEVWRVLKPGGIFRSWTPMYPHPEVFQDPTHLSVWTIKSMDYFCGVYSVANKTYEIQACFEKIEVREEGFYLFAELKKPIA